MVMQMTPRIWHAMRDPKHFTTAFTFRGRVGLVPQLMQLRSSFQDHNYPRRPPRYPKNSEKRYGHSENRGCFWPFSLKVITSGRVGEMTNPESRMTKPEETRKRCQLHPLPFGPRAWALIRHSSLITAARKASRTLLTEVESKQLLAAYGIPTVETHVAFTEDDAVKHAEQLSFPVVIKLFSETLTHKTDMGGVVLDVRDAAAVRRAWQHVYTSVCEKAGNQHFLGVTVQPMVARDGYELILGSSIDPQFGPVMLFGAGGQLVEVFHDTVLGLPPLNATLARRLMEQTKIFTALQGVRGRPPVDLAALERLLVRFSQLVVEQRWIAEIDVNPLLVSVERMLALDARVVLHPPDTREEDLPRPAIAPDKAAITS